MTALSPPQKSLNELGQAVFHVCALLPNPVSDNLIDSTENCCTKALQVKANTFPVVFFSTKICDLLFYQTIGFIKKRNFLFVKHAVQIM